METIVFCDQEEYRQHAREMGYNDESDKILKKQ